MNSYDTFTSPWSSDILIKKTRLFKYIENFTIKNWKFSDKNSDFFHISALNIDCGYSLEPPRGGGSNEYPQFMFLNRNKKIKYTPVNPSFSPFSIAITSLGEERVNLSAFRTFVRFVLVWICRFSLPLGVCEGLRFVIVALPGLFSYLFLLYKSVD